MSMPPLLLSLAHGLPPVQPNPGDLPGGGTLWQLVDGVAGWALIGSLAALLLGAVVWAFGSHSHNVHQAVAGRRAVLASAGAALLIGGASHLITFFFNAGHSLH